MTLRLWTLLLAVAAALPNALAAQEFTTDNIDLVVAKCQFGDYDPGESDSYLRTIDQDNKPIVEEHDVVSFRIIFFLKKVRQDVPVRWVLIWFESNQGGSGLEYSGEIPQDASPDAGFGGYFAQDAAGNRMRIFPLNAVAPSRFLQYGSSYDVSVLFLEVDGEKVNIDVPCSASYTVQ